MWFRCHKMHITVARWHLKTVVLSLALILLVTFQYYKALSTTGTVDRDAAGESRAKRRELVVNVHSSKPYKSRPFKVKQANKTKKDKKINKATNTTKSSLSTGKIEANSKSDKIEADSKSDKATSGDKSFLRQHLDEQMKSTIKTATKGSNNSTITEIISDPNSSKDSLKVSQSRPPDKQNASTKTSAKESNKTETKSNKDDKESSSKSSANKDKNITIETASKSKDSNKTKKDKKADEKANQTGKEKSSEKEKNETRNSGDQKSKSKSETNNKTESDRRNKNDSSGSKDQTSKSSKKEQSSADASSKNNQKSKDATNNDKEKDKKYDNEKSDKNQKNAESVDEKSSKETTNKDSSKKTNEKVSAKEENNRKDSQQAAVSSSTVIKTASSDGKKEDSENRKQRLDNSKKDRHSPISAGETTNEMKGKSDLKSPKADLPEQNQKQKKIASTAQTQGDQPKTDKATTNRKRTDSLALPTRTTETSSQSQSASEEEDSESGAHDAIKTNRREDLLSADFNLTSKSKQSNPLETTSDYKRKDKSDLQDMEGQQMVDKLLSGSIPVDSTGQKRQNENPFQSHIRQPGSDISTVFNNIPEKSDQRKSFLTHSDKYDSNNYNNDLNRLSHFQSQSPDNNFGDLNPNSRIGEQRPTMEDDFNSYIHTMDDFQTSGANPHLPNSVYFLNKDGFRSKQDGFDLRNNYHDFEGHKRYGKSNSPNFHNFPGIDDQKASPWSDIPRDGMFLKNNDDGLTNSRNQYYQSENFENTAAMHRVPWKRTASGNGRVLGFSTDESNNERGLYNQLLSDNIRSASEYPSNANPATAAQIKRDLVMKDLSQSASYNQNFDGRDILDREEGRNFDSQDTPEYHDANYVRDIAKNAIEANDRNRNEFGLREKESAEASRREILKQKFSSLDSMASKITGLVGDYDLEKHGNTYNSDNNNDILQNVDEPIYSADKGTFVPLEQNDKLDKAVDNQQQNSFFFNTNDKDADIEKTLNDYYDREDNDAEYSNRDSYEDYEALNDDEMDSGVNKTNLPDDFSNFSNETQNETKYESENDENGNYDDYGQSEAYNSQRRKRVESYDDGVNLNDTESHKIETEMVLDDYGDVIQNEMSYSTGNIDRNYESQDYNLDAKSDYSTDIPKGNYLPDTNQSPISPDKAPLENSANNEFIDGNFKTDLSSQDNSLTSMSGSISEISAPEQINGNELNQSPTTPKFDSSNSRLSSIGTSFKFDSPSTSLSSLRHSNNFDSFSSRSVPGTPIKSTSNFLSSSSSSQGEPTNVDSISPSSSGSEQSVLFSQTSSSQGTPAQFPLGSTSADEPIEIKLVSKPAKDDVHVLPVY